MKTLSEAERVKVMMNNLSAVDNQGLSYGIMEGYINEGTQDEELDNAITQARIHLEVVSSKLGEFADEVDSGKYDEYLD